MPPSLRQGPPPGGPSQSDPCAHRLRLTMPRSGAVQPALQQHVHAPAVLPFLASRLPSLGSDCAIDIGAGCSPPHTLYTQGGCKGVYGVVFSMDRSYQPHGRGPESTSRARDGMCTPRQDQSARVRAHTQHYRVQVQLPPTPRYTQEDAQPKECVVPAARPRARV